MTKKEKAFNLFMADKSQKDIAKILGVSENTMSKWSKEGNWAETYIKRNISETTREDLTMRIIMHQLRCINKMIDEAQDEDNFTPLEGKYADGILKLTNTIKKEAIGFETITKVVSEFLQFAAQRNLDLGKQMIDISHEFLREQQGFI